MAYTNIYYVLQELQQRIVRLEQERTGLLERILRLEARDGGESERFRELEEQYELLGRKVEAIKPVHIENINYKIQELSVKELKGTLNIGMTALSDPDEIKKWMAESGNDDIVMEDIDPRELERERQEEVLERQAEQLEQEDEQQSGRMGMP